MMYTVIPCLGLRIRSCFIWGALCLVCKALGQRTVVWCLSLLQPTFGHLQTLPEVRRRWAPVEFSAFEYIGSESIHGCCVAIYIYMVRATNIHVHYIYIYKFTHTYIYIYDIFIYNTFTKYTCTYRYTIKHIDRYNRFIQMHREIKSNVHLAMALSNENKPGSCEHGQGACPATWQSFQGHCALATIFRGCWGRITTGISMDIPWRTGWCLEGLGLNQGWDWASNFLV